MRIDSDNQHFMVQDFFKSCSNLNFMEGELPDSSLFVPLKFNENVSLLNRVALNKHQLFFADTSRLVEYRATAFYANPSVFDSLSYRSAIYLEGPVTIGSIDNKLVTELNLEDLIRAMIQFNIIGTHQHLFSELVNSKVKDTNDSFEITYKAVHHYCTNKCYDPSYKFTVRIDKSNGSITIF